jgi:predicted RNase H-like HicB family nuclease
MRTHRFKVLLEWDDDNQEWVTYVPTLNFITSSGRTKEEALREAEKAIASYLVDAENEGLHVPLRETVSEWAELEITLP